MSKAKADDEKDGAKSVADQFLGTLGLVDLVLGTPALYLLRLRLSEGTALSLPSTGVEAADFLLMLTSAALVGKMIVLVASIAIALMRKGIMARGRFSNPIKSLQERLKKTNDTNDSNPLEWAECYIQVTSPRDRAELQSVRSQAILALGASVLAGLYWWQMPRQGSPGPLHEVATRMWIPALVFLALGFLQVVNFVDYLGRLATMIHQYRPKESNDDEEES